mgnify:CR=1 FL=1|tara:strand:- start:800 stop:1102 length:303 start_codon:yes stop_codon:yes gene_type:complete
MVPKKIKLASSNNNIQISYDNNVYLIITSAILRASSPSAENKKNLSMTNIKGYENVLIKNLKKVGNYAIRIEFSDGHNTGIFTWEYLYKIGQKFKNFSSP